MLPYPQAVLVRVAEHAHVDRHEAGRDDSSSDARNFDPKAGTLRINKSRSEGEENEPKTERSHRTIRLLPEASRCCELILEAVSF